MNNIKLSKGMNNSEVNNLISNFIELVSDNYEGNNNPHTWRCKCGKLIINRRWSDITRRNAIYCEECVRRIKYKDKVEKTGEYEYIESFKVGDILSNGHICKIPHIKVKHLYCGSIYEVQAGQFINTGKRCGQCCQKYENSFAYHIEVELGLKLEDVWDFDKNTVNPYYIWKGSSAKVWVKCQNNDTNIINGLKKRDYHKSSEVYCNNYIQGNKCKYCASISTHIYDSFGYMHFDKVFNLDNDNSVSPFSISVSSGVRLKFVCSDCGHKWDSLISNISKGKWCPSCASSKGEKAISVYLRQNNIEYEYEKIFNDLLGVGGGKLSYDFYLQKYNLFIEYQGEQHEKYIPGFHTSYSTYERQQEHDRRKSEYANKNNIELLEIWYWDFDNIAEILDTKLNL